MCASVINGQLAVERTFQVQMVMVHIFNETGFYSDRFLVSGSINPVKLDTPEAHLLCYANVIRVTLDFNSVSQRFQVDRSPANVTRNDVLLLRSK